MDSIDKFIEFYKDKMPETVVLTKDKNRYETVYESIETIKSFVQDLDDVAKVKIYPDELTGTSLCLEILTNLVVVDIMDKFCKALSVADNFEIVARTDGRINLGIVYENVFVPAEPKK